MAPSHSVRILDGNNFVVCEATGDIEATPTEPTGLFSIDTRFLSKWVLTVNGERLNALSYDDLQYYESRFFLVPGLATHYVDAKLSIIRERAVGGSFREHITILNHDEKAVDLEVRMDAGCDFADLFEVKDEILNKKGEIYAEAEPDRLRLGYRRGNFKRETIISSSLPARYDRNGFAYSIHLEPNEQWDTDIDVQTLAVGPGGRDLRFGLQVHGTERLALQHDLEEWIAKAPKVNSEHDKVAATYRKCIVDLAALRFSPLSLGGQTLPAAGLPWFMTMFGRDSILTCLQTLPFTPELSATTLRILAALQGTRFDDFREEDPGRILHEMRYGESAAFEEQPHSPYYGSVDATPLFVVLLDEYEQWSGDAALVKELEQECRRAFKWIDDYADLVGNGYIWYERRNTDTGLENQCWKDSWDSISYRDGTLPPFPRATCEVQGYAYDAKMRGARLAREFWGDPAYAEQLERRPRPSRNGSTGTGGWRTAVTTRSRWIRTDDSATCSAPTSATCSGAGSSTTTGPSRSPTIWSGRDCSPAGECGPSPRARCGTTPSATTTAPSGRSTPRSAPGVCAGTASRRRPPRSPAASWTPPGTSTDGCRRRSAAIRVSRRSSRWSIRRRAAHRHGRRGAAAAAAYHARPGATRGASGGRAASAHRHGPDRGAGHPGPLGAGGRLRARPARPPLARRLIGGRVARADDG
ncbi:hypothetical protein GCM10029963_61310 [Micromonospora andamanensis]